MHRSTMFCVGGSALLESPYPSGKGKSGLLNSYFLRVPPVEIFYRCGFLYPIGFSLLLWCFVVPLCNFPCLMDFPYPCPTSGGNCS